MNKAVIQVGLNQCDSPPRPCFPLEHGCGSAGRGGAHTPSASLGTVRLDLPPLGVGGAGRTGSPPRPGLGTVTDAEQTALRGPLAWQGSAWERAFCRNF